MRRELSRGLVRSIASLLIAWMTAISNALLSSADGGITSRAQLKSSGRKGVKTASARRQ